MDEISPEKQSGSGAKPTIPSARRRGMSPEQEGGLDSGVRSFTGTQRLNRMVTDQAKTGLLAMIADRTVPLRLSGFAADPRGMTGPRPANSPPAAD